MSVAELVTGVALLVVLVVLVKSSAPMSWPARALVAFALAVATIATLTAP